MGSMIGSGIFLVSSEVGRQLTWAPHLLDWNLAFNRLFNHYGRLCLWKTKSTVFPKTGGQYIYLKESYNPLTGFLFGWTTFLVIQTGTIAAVAVAFARYAGFIFPRIIE